MNMPGYTVGMATLILPDGTERVRAQVLGTKIVDTPACMEWGDCLLSKRKLCQYLKLGDALEDSGATIRFKAVAHARYSVNLTGYALMTWKQYGGPLEPLPQHDRLNVLLVEMSGRTEIEMIAIREVPKTRKEIYVCKAAVCSD